LITQENTGGKSDRNEVHEVTRQKENGFLFVSAFKLLLKLIENLTEVNTSLPLHVNFTSLKNEEVNATKC